MKKVLHAIGSFFSKIFNWIKNTAWIQPLLIVGIIFGIIMSIKPISKWISDIANVQTDSTFYKDNLVNYDTFAKKVESNGDNDVLLVIFIDEENRQCEQCKSSQEQFDTFFSDNHTNAEAGRNYNVIVLDTAADEFFEDQLDDKTKLKDAWDDIVVPYNFVRVWEDMPTDFNDGSENFSEQDEKHIPTPTIARFDGTTCVGISMGFNSYDKFTRFCYADDVNSDNSFINVPGEK